MAKPRMSKKWPRILYIDPLKQTVRKVDKQRPRPSRHAGPQLVCSYNWVVDETKRSRPVTRINVPGDVPVYRPGRVKLPRFMEVGKEYKIMGNFETSQISSVPFEGLFLATRIMNPTFRFDKVDLVISISMLIRFLVHHFQSQGVDPVGSTPFDKLLRIDEYRNLWTATMYTVQDTLFIHSPLFRKKSGIRDLSRPLTGLNFEEEVATLRGAMFDDNAREYHYRAIQYHLGGLNCVILYEADARWLSEGQPDDTAAISHPHNTPTQQPALYSLDNRVPVFQQGSGAPQSDMVEIKLRSRWRSWDRGPNPFLPCVEQEDKDDIWFRMGHAKDNLYVYFTHTGRFVTGYIKKGSVESIGISHTTRARRKMAYKLSPHLPRLEELFRRLREIALEAKRPCWLQTLPSSSLISVATQSRKLPEKHPVPQEIVETFWESAKNPETANAPTAGEPQRSDPAKVRSEDAASLPDSSEEAKEETESVNVRTQGRPHSSLPEEPKSSPCMEWENLRREVATGVLEGGSKKGHPLTRSRLPPMSDAEIIMETREVLRRGSQRLAELAGVLGRL